VFEVQNIQLSMAESKRPQQIAVYKSVTGFTQLVPWLYLVTLQSECMSLFSVPVKVVPDSADDVLCLPYTTPPAEMDELVSAWSLHFPATIYRVAQKTGPPSHCKYSEIP